MRFTFAFPRPHSTIEHSSQRGGQRSHPYLPAPLLLARTIKSFCKIQFAKKKGNVKIESKWKFKWKSPTQAHSIECETEAASKQGNLKCECLLSSVALMCDL